MFRRVAWLSASLAMFAVGVAGCGNQPDGGLEEVEVDRTIPQGKNYIFEVTIPAEELENSSSAETFELTGTSTSRFGRGEQTRLSFSNPKNDGFTIRFNLGIGEGETGTFETIQTSELVRGQDKYANSDPLRVTLREHGDGRMAGAVVGEFPTKRTSGSIDTPVELRGKFDFEYDE